MSSSKKVTLASVQERIEEIAKLFETGGTESENRELMAELIYLRQVLQSLKSKQSSLSAEAEDKSQKIKALQTRFRLQQSLDMVASSEEHFANGVEYLRKSLKHLLDSQRLLKRSLANAPLSPEMRSQLENEEPLNSFGEAILMALIQDACIKFEDQGLSVSLLKLARVANLNFDELASAPGSVNQLFLDLANEDNEAGPTGGEE